jgi:hypothetical protein
VNRRAPCVTSSYDWSRDVALRLQHLPIGVAKLSWSAEASACQPISLRAPNGTKTAPRSIWIIPERLILIRPTRTSWKRLSLRMVLLVVTCPANGAGGRRSHHSIGRAPAQRRMGCGALSCSSNAMLCHLLALTLSSSIVVADHRECGPYSQDADTTGNQ